MERLDRTNANMRAHLHRTSLVSTQPFLCMIETKSVTLNNALSARTNVLTNLEENVTTIAQCCVRDSYASAVVVSSLTHAYDNQMLKSRRIPSNVFIVTLVWVPVCGSEATWVSNDPICLHLDQNEPTWQAE